LDRRLRGPQDRSGGGGRQKKVPIPAKGIFGPRWDEVAGGWKRLHDEKLHNLYASLNIIRVIKSRRMR